MSPEREPTTIREIADETGLSAHTLRYYERIGLMVPVERSASGHRVYDAHALEWAVLLTHLRETGMPIQAMLQFANLVRQGAGTEQERLTLLEQHLLTLDTQIARLEAAREMVLHKIAVYRAGNAETPAARKEITE